MSGMSNDFEKANAKAEKQHHGILDEGESILAESAQVILTNQRLIQFGLSGKIKNEIPLLDISEFQTLRKKFAKAGPLISITRDGSKIDFGNLFDSEYERFKEALSAFQSGTVINSEVKKAKSLSGQGAERQSPNSIEIKYGNVVSQAHFGSAFIKIYSKGYVEIAKGYGLLKNQVEKLLSIDGEAQITKKTGLGRAAAAVVTFGVNLASPNQRGNLILTITTDREVHVLFHDMPFAHDIKGMNELVSAGKAILARISNSGKGSEREMIESNDSLSNQLRELSRMKDEGLLTADEFAMAKRKLLS